MKTMRSRRKSCMKAMKLQLFRQCVAAKKAL